MIRTCAIHQPNFMPWLGYFYKIANSDVFVILDNVDILLGSSKAITNRVKIKTQMGEQWLTVPIKKGDSKLIKDIKVQDNNWRIKLLKTIQQNYGKTAYFSKIFPLVEQLILFQTENLSAYNTNIITIISKHLGINTPIILASELTNISTDRNQRIIDICKNLNCNTYLSGKGGTKYHDISLFNNNNINIHLTNYTHPVYNQLYGDFVEGLSVIDYLFSNSMEGLKW
mgnify:FL=1